MANNTEALKSQIKGWGADLDPKNRPNYPKETDKTPVAEAKHVELEKQVPKTKILVSPEHKGLTPVFGTSCPLKGMSGLIRSYAFNFSEGKKIHWLLLLLGDRVDVFESAAMSLLKGKAHNPFAEMGLGAEFKDGAFRSRFTNHRSDARRWRNEAFILAGLGGVSYLFARSRGKKAA